MPSAAAPCGPGGMTKLFSRGHPKPLLSNHGTLNKGSASRVLTMSSCSGLLESPLSPEGTVPFTP